MASNTTPDAGTATTTATSGRAATAWLVWPGAKPALLGLGWLCVGLGMVGVVVPGMPTTIFLIIALWAFSKSSDRFHGWLYNHSRLGPPLQAWSEHRVIPVRAKLLAVTLMATSWLIVVMFVADGWTAPAILGAVLLGVATYIVTRRDKRPA
jgi:uncharacterized membrane protein YbaN (DUF454 family)